MTTLLERLAEILPEASISKVAQHLLTSCLGGML